MDDDRARWSVIIGCILIVGTAASIDVVLFDSSVDDALVLMTVLTVILLLCLLAWRSILGFPARETDPEFPSRRSLIIQLASIVFVAFTPLMLRAFEVREVEQTLTQASRAAFSSDDAQKVEMRLAAARANRLRVDSRVLQVAGAAFINTSGENPDAWSTVREFLSYRSFLNVSLYPKVTPATGTSNYRTTVTITNLGPHQDQPALHVIFAGGYASGENSARLESLANPQPVGSEFSYFIIEGGNATLGLDGEFMKNVIIRDADISYAGGAVRLENVWFVNCTFHDYTLKGKATNLGETILASASVTFVTSS